MQHDPREVSGWTKVTVEEATGDALHPLVPRGCVLEDAGLVDGQHRVFVFRVDYGRSLFPVLPTRPPRMLVKYVDQEDYAPCTAVALKLATLEHYRVRYPDREGVGDSMEGRATIAGTFSEMRLRTGVAGYFPGEHHVGITSTYQVDDRSLIFCTAASGARLEKDWIIGCPIRSASELARLLGIECARQGSRIWSQGSGGLDTFVNGLLGSIRVPRGPAVLQRSQLAGVIQVFHGPVVYRDEPGHWLFDDVRSQDRGSAVEFLKRTAFDYQKEYRFVVRCPGYQPAGEEVFLENTADMRLVFADCIPCSGGTDGIRPGPSRAPRRPTRRVC